MGQADDGPLLGRLRLRPGVIKSRQEHLDVLVGEWLYGLFLLLGDGEDTSRGQTVDYPLLGQLMALENGGLFLALSQYPSYKRLLLIERNKE